MALVSSKDASRRWRDERKAKHECTRCGAPLPADDARLKCAKCREICKELSRQYKERLRAGKPAPPPKQRGRKAKPPEQVVPKPKKEKKVAEPKKTTRRQLQLMRDQQEAIRLSRGQNEYERRELEELAESRKNRYVGLRKIIDSFMNK